MNIPLIDPTQRPDSTQRNLPHITYSTSSFLRGHSYFLLRVGHLEIGEAQERGHHQK